MLTVSDVTDDEIDAVAEELAKAGGLSWYPGRERGPLLKVVTDRYRDRALLVIAALDRYRAQKPGATAMDRAEADLPPALTEAGAVSDSIIQVGATVVSRPPGRAESLSVSY